jgi:hypothetical protein
VGGVSVIRHTVFTVTCNHDGCKASLCSDDLRLREGATAADVRAVARERGWVAVNPVPARHRRWAYGRPNRLDLCPSHKEDGRR